MKIEVGQLWAMDMTGETERIKWIDAGKVVLFHSGKTISAATLPRRARLLWTVGDASSADNPRNVAPGQIWRLRTFTGTSLWKVRERASGDLWRIDCVSPCKLFCIGDHQDSTLLERSWSLDKEVKVGQIWRYKTAGGDTSDWRVTESRGVAWMCTCVVANHGFTLLDEIPAHMPGDGWTLAQEAPERPAAPAGEESAGQPESKVRAGQIWCLSSGGGRYSWWRMNTLAADGRSWRCTCIRTTKACFVLADEISTFVIDEQRGWTLSQEAHESLPPEPRCPATCTPLAPCKRENCAAEIHLKKEIAVASAMGAIDRARIPAARGPDTGIQATRYGFAFTRIDGRVVVAESIEDAQQLGKKLPGARSLQAFDFEAPIRR